MTDKTPYESRSNIPKTFYYDKEHRPTIKIDNKQITDLFNLVGNMNINEVKQFMIMEQIPYSIVDNNNNTLIHRVLLDNDLLKSEIQRLQMIKFLYNENVNPDGPNYNNLTPLHIACSKQYFHIIKYLIEIGVNINYQDNFGNTPLHRLFSGSIKIEEKITISDIIPKPKKKDLLNTIIWTTERIKIWDSIKNSNFITAIDNTLKNSIGSEPDEINVITDFQKEFSRTNLNLNINDDLKKLKELQAPSINKFKTIIEKRWGMFPTIDDITIHPVNIDSFPNNDPSKLSIIKNSDTKKYIKTTLYNKLTSIISLLREFKNDDLKFDNNDINQKLLKDYLSPNPKINLDSTNIVPVYYNSYNDNYKHMNSFDFADNIIDVKYQTFIGGARVITINNNVDNTMFKELFIDNKQKEYIIPIILYTLFVPFATAKTFIGSYDIAANNLYNGYIELLSNFINNELTAETINRIKSLVPKPPLLAINVHHGIIKLLDNLKPDTDKIGWLYCFINNIVCAKRFDEQMLTGPPQSNLFGEIPLSIIYLIAGLINYKGGDSDNLIMSINQSMRKSLFNNIYTTAGIFLFNQFRFKPTDIDTKKGMMYVSLIYLIFAEDNSFFNNILQPNPPPLINLDNYDNSLSIVFGFINSLKESDELKFILKYAFTVMNNKPRFPDINAYPIMFKMADMNEYEPAEFLVKMLSIYYNKMIQPPQMQMVSDIIDIIRKNTDKFDPNAENLITIDDKFNNLIQKTYQTIASLPTDLELAIIPNLYNMNTNMNNSKYFKLIGNNSKAINIWNIINYALPSRVNYFLARPNDNQRINMEYYTLKFIECYYLGLNFLGHNQSLKRINNIIVCPKNPSVLTNYNLFNFDITNTMDVADIELYYTFGNEHLNRPTTIMNVINTILNTETNLNNLINIIIERLLYMFTIMEKEKGIKYYASYISYLYPDLLILNNYSHIFKNINGTFRSYNNIINSIKKITDVDINRHINSFDTFKLNNFELCVNQINGYIYLLYYFNATTDKIKIPSFIYHALDSKKQLSVYDNETELNILNPTSNTTDAETNTTNIDKPKGHINRDIGFFYNIIYKTGFTTRSTIKAAFKISKNKKLPPSLNIVLNDFYRLNIIETIKQNTIVLDDQIINVPINDNTKNIQLLYLKSKIIEELIQLYIKNKIHIYAAEIYNKLINITSKISIEIQPLFETIDFSVNLKELPTNEFIHNLDVNKQSGLDLYYTFVEPKKIKPQFYIYPDNYFGSNLLKTKYTININPEIIELMLSNNSNILLHNNEKISPLVMMIKNNYYEAFNIIKENFDINNYNSEDYYSPQYYLMQNYKNHMDNYYSKMSDSQYNELVTIIQSNESYNNNILKYMDVSFDVLKYIVHQYLSENIIRFSESVDSDYLQKILIFSKFEQTEINNIGKCNYNSSLNSNISIPNVDEGVIIDEIIKELKDKKKKEETLLNKYNKEIDSLTKLNLLSKLPTDKISKTEMNIQNYEKNIEKLEEYKTNKITNLTMQNINDKPKIIQRYDELITKIGYNYISYMEGWKQYINNNNNNNNIEQLSINLINIQNNMESIDKDTIDILYNFYNHNNNIIKTYFENQRYIVDNKVLDFVYDLLVHLTKTFICSNIESVIKKVLYEYIINTQNVSIQTAIDQINLMIVGIKDKLYKLLPEKFVSNSVNIYFNKDDETENPIESAAEILNNLIDLLKTSSFIMINDYTINILKNSINPYFDTITYKLINNWNVVIENIFLFHINHYRILECIKSLN